MKSSNRTARVAAASILVCFLALAWQTLLLSPAPFFRYALGGPFVIQMATSSKRREWLWVAAGAVVLAICYRAEGGMFPTDLHSLPSCVVAFLGLASCVVLGAKAILQTDYLSAFVAAAALPIASVLVGLVLVTLIGVQPHVYDFYLYRFDDALGFQASAEVGRWFMKWTPLDFVCRVAYEALPLAQACVLAAYLRKRLSPWPVYLTMGVAGLLGCALYLLMPAVGPAHIFGAAFAASAPHAVPLLTTESIHATPRNGIPSLHLTWTLLILWNVPPKLRGGRGLACVFLLLTILATLGTGEHYLVDLIVAVPFAFCVQSLCFERWRCALLAGGVTLAWVLYLRFGMPYLVLPPAVCWAANLLSVSVPWLGRAEFVARECSPLSTQHLPSAVPLPVS